ncbi:MAG: hypothetical protein JWO81_1433 [Alphaproteobacteria bacterium]|nr:hypothetical protein [Alphaproteobacteria bacterium]
MTEISHDPDLQMQSLPLRPRVPLRQPARRLRVRQQLQVRRALHLRPLIGGALESRTQGASSLGVPFDWPLNFLRQALHPPSIL